MPGKKNRIGSAEHEILKQFVILKFKEFDNINEIENIDGVRSL